MHPTEMDEALRARALRAGAGDDQCGSEPGGTWARFRSAQLPDAAVTPASPLGPAIVLALAGTPPSIVDRLSEAINKALADPPVFNRLQEIGIDPTPGSTPKQVGAFIEAELAKWAPIIKASGAQID